MIVLAGLILMLAPALAQADPGDRIEQRFDNRGDRIDQRLDNNGNRINVRLDRKGNVQNIAGINATTESWRCCPASR